jgi:hypothetical protein
MRNISRFRLRAHTLKVEAAAWLEDGSCVCDQCPGEDEHVQNEVHALLNCQDHRVCELRKHFSFLFTPFFEDFSASQPFLLQQVNNQLVHDFLSQQNNRLFLFLSELMDLFETSQQPISQTTTVKKARVINALLNFRNAFLNSRALHANTADKRAFLSHKLAFLSHKRALSVTATAFMSVMSAFL